MTEFIRITRGKRAALVHPDYRDSVADALFDDRGCRSAGTTGRTSMLAFDYEGGTGLIRPYHRGGLVSLILKDAYAFVNRPLLELTVHRYAHDNGLSTPPPLGACWTRTGPFYRGRYATKEVDAVDLLHFLAARPPDAEEKLRHCGQVIRKMHELGIVHADLQLKNILVGESASYVIDFDNARHGKSVGSIVAARNLLRLRRSMEKAGYSADIFQRVCEGYGVKRLPLWLSAAYVAKGALSDTFSRKKGTYDDASDA